MSRPTTPDRRGRRRRHRDRGMATIEATGGLVMMFVLLTLGVQLVVWGIAAYGGRLAADHAAQAARVHGATAAAGHAEADLILSGTVGRKLRDPHVTVTRTTTTVTVRVVGHAQSVIPGFAPVVGVTVSVPVEPDA
ncbi:TadE family protein [Micromonospora sp. WMMD1082]|uniref:TadE family protein n=1 Tax=Micromonospora sp. WMMD1082 TaxID=3016104 RepID=UPI0024164E24|nr:TadE family protein [Micromonospora sp. WMMD1082]MDG4795434.1 TadE family protein [Micromonospora sp. WMMD1082]